MLNNVTLSRNNFEHFPTGPPKQFSAVEVSENSVAIFVCFLLFFDSGRMLPTCNINFVYSRARLLGSQMFVRLAFSGDSVRAMCM